MASLNGKVIAITGGARGMGATEAGLFVAEGASVVLGDLLHDEGRALAAQLGERACYAPLDVRNEADWQAFFSIAADRFGRLDGLVNNAGTFQTGPIEQLSVEQITRSFEINQLGTMLGVKHAVPVMRRSGGGSIVNISSFAGVRPFAGVGAYAATKWAVRGITRVAALEHVRDNIRVNAVLPGYIQTPMTEGLEELGLSLTPAGRAGTPAEVAAVVRFLLSDESSFVTGADYLVDGAAAL